MIPCNRRLLLPVFVLSLVINSIMAQTPASVTPMRARLENYDYPYPVKYLPLSIQQQTLQMAYMDVRPEKPNGHTVLLLHGKNFFGAYWAKTARALADAGFRVVIPDQVGFGKSSKPASLQYSFQLLATNTRILLDSLLIDKACVLGHSMGGMVATRFTLMFPDRVEKFILEDPIGLEDWKLKVPYQTVDDWYKGELKQDYNTLKKYELENYFHGQWSPAYDPMLNVIAGWTLSPDYPSVAWNSALTYDMIFTQPVCYEFEKITTPTLLIIGQADRTALGKDLVSDSVKQTMGNYPVLGRHTHDRIRNSQLIELPGIGHVPHMEGFDHFIRSLLVFLQQ